MYQRHFGLRDQPFSIAPDPSFLYLSQHHQEALGHLLYGAGQTGGFVALTGEVGTGKTTLVRTLLEQKLDNIDNALCLNPGLTVNEFIENLCEELHIEYPEDSSVKTLTSALNRSLLASHARGRRSVAIIDEAQNLSREVLEQIRLLTNLETNKDKLLRIILVGQPELQTLLARNDLRQLAQRITARYHLGELSAADTAGYIRHRLGVAGSHSELFTKRAIRSVFKASAGTPRLINIICDRAMTNAYSAECAMVEPHHVKAAVTELLPSATHSSRGGAFTRWATVACLASTCLLLWRFADSNSVLPSPSVVAERGALQSEPVRLPTPVERSNRLAQEPEEAWAALDTEHRFAAAGAVDKYAPLFSYQTAQNDLFKRWQVFAEESGSLCDIATQYQLRCLEGNASLDELMGFNRPALLTISRQGSIGTVLLQAVTSGRVLLQTSAGLAKLTVAELEQFWTGHYQLLLRMPAAGVLTLRPAQRNAGVSWLRQQMALFDGITDAVSLPTVYDQDLQQRVEQFQYASGLIADGVVGGLTLTQLHNLAPAANTPLLQLPEVR